MLGGRTNHWGRISLRNGPYDFKPHRRDGLGFDWPIAYEDVAPYYDKVERLIGVYGSNEGTGKYPGFSGGVPASPAGAADRRSSDSAARRPHRRTHYCRHTAPYSRSNSISSARPRCCIPVIPTHRRSSPRTCNAAQHVFGRLPADAAVAIRANYQSTTVHLPPALATGNLDILTDAMVREVQVDKNGLARGVTFVDKTNDITHSVTARVVVLAASACETVRILLNSKSAQFPQGLANSSGKVGRYLMDTVGSSLYGQIPLLESLPPKNEDGASGDAVYAPWWLYQQQHAGKLDFARGYHIEMGGGKQMPGVSTMRGAEWLTGGSYGKKFKEDARRYFGSFVGFAGRGEMIPNEQSYCEIDSSVKDKWGIPVLRFHWQWSPHETRQAAHMQKTFAGIVEAMGGRVKDGPITDGSKAISPGGYIIHEVGGAIMGAKQESSVTNQWCQTWDVKNLFLTDGAVFASNADKNPTLTIMALAWRSADHILDRMRRKEL